MRKWVTIEMARKRRKKAMLVATQAVPAPTQVRVVRAVRRATSTALFDGVVQNGQMGAVGGRPFFSQFHMPGRDMTVPFAQGPFSCFIRIGGPTSDETLSTLARALLRQGLYAAYCAGVDCERLGEIFDEILDDGHYFHGDAAVTAMAFEDESIEDALEYFTLPNGHDVPHLVLTVGSAEHHQETLTAFSSAMERMKLAFCG